MIGHAETNDALDPKVKAPRFLLVGIMGVYNYGGEGIVRGTIRMLREKWPDCAITYASGLPVEDATALSDIENINIVQSRNRWTVKRIVFGIARRLGIGQGTPLPLKRSLLNDIDVMLSIGGDNYTLSPDNRMQFYTAQLMSLGEKALTQGKKYVLWGASVGSFESNAHAKKIFTRHLQKVSSITVREMITLNYLKSLGCVNNVALVADPAFLMPPAVDVPILKKDNKLFIAINFSPLSINHVFSRNQQEFKKMKNVLVACLYKLLEIRDINILLVPHVIPFSGVSNDDYSLLQNVYSEMSNLEDRVTLLPRDLGGPKTKAILSQCDAVVSARMHCCIAAISAGVPTLFIQYSQKALGMVRYVYGNDDWCIHLQDLSPEKLHRKIVAMLENRQEISTMLKGARPKWENEARLGVELLSNII